MGGGSLTAAPRVGLLAQDAFTKPSGMARYQGEMVRWMAPRLNLALLVVKPDAYRGGQALPPEAKGTPRLAYSTWGAALRSAPAVLARLPSNRFLLKGPFAVKRNNVSSRLLAGAFIDRSRVDLVHGAGAYLPDTRRKARRVVTLPDTTPISMPESHTAQTRGLFLRPRELRHDDHVIVISNSALDDFRAAFTHLEDQTHVIPLGIDPAVFSPEGPRTEGKAPYLLSVGTIEPRKNLIAALAAFERVASAHEGLGWKVAGARGWGWEAFSRALAKSPVRDRVEVLGPVPEGDLPALYRGASCLLFPSQWEGFGFPVLEAMACGTPVAASDIPVLREVGGSVFEACDPTDPASIAESVERAAFGTGGAAQRRADGVERARAFSWDRCAREHLRVYALALGIEPAALLRPGAGP